LILFKWKHKQPKICRGKIIKNPTKVPHAKLSAMGILGFSIAFSFIIYVGLNIIEPQRQHLTNLTIGSTLRINGRPQQLANSIGT